MAHKCSLPKDIETGLGTKDPALESNLVDDSGSRPPEADPVLSTSGRKEVVNLNIVYCTR